MKITTIHKKALIAAISLAVWTAAVVIGSGACSSTRTQQVERVGMSAAPITSSSIYVADGGATIPSNASTAAGYATYEDSNKTDQLTVWQGEDGTTIENYWGQRWISDPFTTIAPGAGNWPTPTTLADGFTLNTFDGPVKVAYLNEANKFVIASAASSTATGGAGKDVDVVLVTTTNGGLSSGWHAGISVLCNFSSSGGAGSCPGTSEEGYEVKSIALAVDPNTSVLAADGGATTYHDVFLYFTVSNPPGGRIAYSFEFYVDSSGNINPLYPMDAAWSTLSYYVCGTGGCDDYADTFTMVVGHQKSCISGSAPFLFGMWANHNPIDDGACPNSTTNSVAWGAVALMNPDSSTYTDWTFANVIGTVASEPDCIGDQINWPAASLTYDPTPTATSGGGGSVDFSVSVPNSTHGQQIQTFYTVPIGCSGTGRLCGECCPEGCSAATVTNQYTTPDVCEYYPNGTGNPGVVEDCNTPGCTEGSTDCPQIANDEILPVLSYNAETYISLAWYDNRDGTGSPKSFGEIRGYSAWISLGSSDERRDVGVVNRRGRA
jgi:hypothetical protein